MIGIIVFTLLLAVVITYYNFFVDQKRESEKPKQDVRKNRQAEVAGNDLVRGAILSNTYTGPWPERRGDGGWLSIFDNLRIMKVAGMNFRQGMNRYKGFIDAALVPEPKNEFDPNAIKVVAIDGHHLGYIQAEQTEFVRSLTANEFPHRCKCEVCEGFGDDDEKYYFGYVYIKRLD